MTTTEKTCFKCKSIKPLTEFYKHPQMADGHVNKCKECNKKDVIANRLLRVHHYREYDRLRASDPKRVIARFLYAHSAAGRRAYQRAHKSLAENYPYKRKAVNAVSNALRDGKMQKLHCFICGSEKVEAHHTDYSMPLMVEWLCKKHHTAAHVLARSIERGSHGHGRSG